MNKKIVAFLVALALLPACRNAHKPKCPCDAYEIEERISGPAGWDIDDEQLNFK